MQLWGPRFSVFVVAACDLAVFSLGTMPDDAKGRQRAEELAASLSAALGDERVGHKEAGARLGVDPNRLRYAAATGTVLIRWEGARQPTVWIVPAPEMTAREARLELARRYLRSLRADHARGVLPLGGDRPASRHRGVRGAGPVADPGPDTRRRGVAAQRRRGPVRAEPGPAAAARLLPSGDAFFLLQGADRDLLVPDAARQRELWTSRVWPGALLVDGEVAGTWRRAGAVLTVQRWRPLSAAERDAVEAEAASLPLPGIPGRSSSAGTRERQPPRPAAQPPARFGCCPPTSGCPAGDRAAGRARSTRQRTASCCYPTCQLRLGKMILEEKYLA